MPQCSTYPVDITLTCKHQRNDDQNLLVTLSASSEALYGGYYDYKRPKLDSCATYSSAVMKEDFHGCELPQIVKRIENEYQYRLTVVLLITVAHD